MAAGSERNPSPAASKGETPINFSSAGILPRDSAGNKITAVRGSGLSDDRDPRCALSGSGMPKPKSFLLLKFHAAVSSDAWEQWKHECITHRWSCLFSTERISGMVRGVGFISKTCSLCSFPLYPEVAVYNAQRIAGICYSSIQLPAVETVSQIHAQMEGITKQELK